MNARAEMQELADKADEAIAIERITERLKDGKQVGRADFTGILDDSLQTEPNYARVLSELSALLQTDDTYAAMTLKDRIRDGLIERYIDSHREDLVHSELELMAFEKEFEGVE
jgi:hypothetical protein